MAVKKYKGSFFEHFSVIYDTRQEGKVRHKLIDIIFIAIAATICSCDDWEDVEAWAIEREDWLRKYLELPNGIPTHHTIERVLNLIDPKQFERCFVLWMREVTEIGNNTVIAIDGKTMRGTENKKNNKKAIHIVSAWCSSNKLIIGQVKADEKSNEITAIPELLDMLLIKGSIVTIDAMGCQKDIAEKIVKHNKADYVLALKENHKVLYDEVKEYFKDAKADKVKNEKIECYRTMEKSHGRIEERIFYYSTDISWMKAKDDWTKLNGIGMVIRKCEENGRKTEECRYYLGSIKNVKDFSQAARKHWEIESTHWNLDVTFREDENRNRTGNKPQNIGLLKRIALNLVKKDEERYPKKSLKSRRFQALLSLEYLEYILFINFR